MQKLDDIPAIKDDVISAGHAALDHDSVPSCHLEKKKMQFITEYRQRIRSPLPVDTFDPGRALVLEGPITPLR